MKKGLKSKIDLKSVVKNTLLSGATGVAVDLVSSAVMTDKPKTMSLIIAGLGVVLPEVVKGEESKVVSNSLIAVAGYRMSQEYDLATTVGIKGTEQQRGAVGNAWNPSHVIFEEKIKGTNNKTTASSKSSGNMQ